MSLVPPKKIKTKFTTVWVIVINAAVLIGWDIWAAYNPPEHDTISEVLLTNAQKHPVLSFIFGVLMGHLFWPQVVSVKENKEK